jgi:hypothetical protein
MPDLPSKREKVSTTAIWHRDLPDARPIAGDNTRSLQFLTTVGLVQAIGQALSLALKVYPQPWAFGRGINEKTFPKVCMAFIIFVDENYRI